MDCDSHTAANAEYVGLCSTRVLHNGLSQATKRATACRPIEGDQQDSKYLVAQRLDLLFAFTVAVVAAAVAAAAAGRGRLERHRHRLQQQQLLLPLQAEGPPVHLQSDLMSGLAQRCVYIHSCSWR